ncbi:MAG: M3 family metallopeptidase [Bacteroidota bacterium]
MKHFISLLSFILCTAMITAQTPAPSENPFSTEFTTPFGTPPFDKIRNDHFMPAFTQGMEVQQKEIQAIAADTLPATFFNTVEKLDRTGDMLGRVSAVFYSLQSANTNDEIQSIANDVTPLLSKHQDDIFLNEQLFARIKAVYDKRSAAGLNPEQLKLLEDYYVMFVRGGASLSAEKKERFRAINQELSVLQLKFDENVLKETNNFILVIDKKKDLAGLPKAAVDAAAEAANQAGMKGKWLFTVKKPSMLPFLQYAKNRALREKLYKAYYNRGDNNNEYDNKINAAKIAALRVERANLLGYSTYADFSLERTMAKTPQNVYDLLNKLWTPALKNAKKEVAEMQKIVNKEGGKFSIQPWDWWYYAEKVRKQKFDLDENELRPYFLMENVRKGVFDLATKLYGIRFVERKDITTYSDEVTVFEVLEKDGSHIGLLYTDYFPRPGKQAGAWCGGFRSQEIRDGKMITPLVTNVGNFSRPTADQPSLLSMDEVETLFHEFGHALNALFSNVTYKGLSIPGDIIELPSQIMENWAFHPDVMKTYAFHYKTGKVMPQQLINKIQQSDKFNQGFATVEYLAACFLDMNWHTLTSTTPVETNAFENQSLQKIGLIPEIISRYRSTYFLHIFSSSYYATGYYYYIWAEVLDADAFEAFKENGLYDQATAKKFRDFILARLQADDAMTQYERFRGKKPDIEPLLKRRGLE